MKKIWKKHRISLKAKLCLCEFDPSSCTVHSIVLPAVLTKRLVAAHCRWQRTIVVCWKDRITNEEVQKDLNNR